jgi:hypothetical protein
MISDAHASRHDDGAVQSASESLDHLGEFADRHRG